MVAVHILIFGEMAAFKIVPFMAPHVKTKTFLWSYEKFFSANQNSPICMKTTDIKLLLNIINAIQLSSFGRLVCINYTINYRRRICSYLIDVFYLSHIGYTQPFPYI